MNWSSRRKIIYGASFSALLLAFVVYKASPLLFPQPTCFDTKKNGYELGIDCGGLCMLTCQSEIEPLSVVWARAVPVSLGEYDFVAMLSNKNTTNAPQGVAYTFIALDKEGKVMTSVDGVSTVVTDGDFPIISHSVELDTAPASVIVRLSQPPYYKTPEKPELPAVRSLGWVYEPGSISRVTVTLKNTTQTTFLKTPVRIVLFDSQNNAIGVGESIVPSLGKEEEKEVVFTWHGVFAKAPTTVRIYPIIDPFIEIR